MDYQRRLWKFSCTYACVRAYVNMKMYVKSMNNAAYGRVHVRILAHMRVDGVNKYESSCSPN